MTNKSQVLTDHKRVGKRFIPPFIDKLGSTFKETSWVKLTIPELIWIALLNYRYGYQAGADLSLSIAKATKETTGKVEWYVPLSSFSALTGNQKEKIIVTLKQSGKLDKLSAGLSSLNYLYPKSPLAFLGKNKDLPEGDRESLLSEVKNTLTSLYDKYSVEATFTQANSIYICFVLGKLKVSSKTSLANFPEIENYPHTEESKKIAAFVRASVNGFIGMDSGDNMTDWANYFWNHGLEIDKCE